METSGFVQSRTRWLIDHADMVVTVLAMLLVGFLTAWATSDNIVLEYDSVYYLSVAENVSNGVGLREYTGGELTNFPPGYPFLISFLMLFGWGSMSAAVIINVVSAMAIIALAARIAFHLGPHGSAAFVALGVAAWPAFLVMHSQAMSEPVFTVALLTLILSLVRLPAAPNPVTWRHLTPLILASWACCLIRYQGYVVVPAVMLVLLLQKRTWTDRIITTCKYYVPAFLGIIAVVLQNVLRAGSLGGPVTEARESFADDVRSSLIVVGRLFSTDDSWTWSDSSIVSGLVVVGVLLVSLLAGFLLFRRSESRSRLRALPVFLFLLPMFTFVSARRVWVEFTPRIFFPLLPLIVILIVVVVLSAISPLTRPIRIAVPALGIASIALLMSSTVVAANRAHDTVDELNREEILVPELGRAVAELPASAVVYSNNAEGIWLSSRVPRVRRYDRWAWRVSDLQNPDPTRQPPDRLIKRVWRLAEDLCSGFYLAWTDLENDKRGGGDLDMLDGFATWSLVEDFDGGALYYVENNVDGLCELVPENEGDDQLV
ncbi:MAG: hypothetical protein ACKOI2_01115 [Actinomycetota bacterium]